MTSSAHPRPIVLWIFVAFAVVGAVFAAISSRDFVMHLDRQVHAVTCSFIPGLGAADRTGTTGCYAALMSPYSSVLRTSLWGGIPIALPALSVFAFLLFLGIALAAGRAWADLRETLFLLLATLLPLCVSLLYLGLSVFKLGTVCKVCVGIYVASAGVFVTALLLHLRARSVAETDIACATTMLGTGDGQRDALGRPAEAGSERGSPRRMGALPRPLPWARWALTFFYGVLFVAVPLALYVTLKPRVTEAVTRCGALLHPEDRHHVRVQLHPRSGGVPAIEILDPLCPACHAFARRLDASGLRPELDLQTVLFPLDRECNWMVPESLHPGACAVSEAVLCAGDDALEVLKWAETHGAELRQIGAGGSAPVYARLRARFPQLARCLGRPAAKVRLNRSLRWVASNSLPVLTPQLFVRGRKICDEDTDLGLEYALARMLEQTGTAAERPAPARVSGAGGQP